MLLLLLFLALIVPQFDEPKARKQPYTRHCTRDHQLIPPPDIPATVQREQERKHCKHKKCCAEEVDAFEFGA